MSTKTVGTTSKDHLSLQRWATEQSGDRPWAIEDCHHLSRRFERDPIAAGERIVRVPLKLMANVRDGARTYGESDPIDALAVARAALREPDLPEARLDGAERELRLLVDHCEDLVAERTRIIARLRWHLYQLDPGWKAPTKIDRTSAFDKVQPVELFGPCCRTGGPTRRAPTPPHCRDRRTHGRDYFAERCAGSFLVSDSWVRIAHCSEAGR
ncbi:IS110 family transposase [Rhodococcus koreensis]